MKHNYRLIKAVNIINITVNFLLNFFFFSVPISAHTPYYYSDCGTFERAINQYAIPLLQLLCLAGNFSNLLIYRLPYFDGSASVHFLRAKAIANIIFVQSRIFEVTNFFTAIWLAAINKTVLSEYSMIFLVFFFLFFSFFRSFFLSHIYTLSVVIEAMK